MNPQHYVYFRLLRMAIAVVVLIAVFHETIHYYRFRVEQDRVMLEITKALFEAQRKPAIHEDRFELL